MHQDPSEQSEPRDPGGANAPDNNTIPTAHATSPELERQAAELGALRRWLMASEGTFSLAIAICNSPRLREHLIQRSTGMVGGVHVVPIAEGTVDVFGFVRSQIGEARPHALFVTNLERCTPSQSEGFTSLRSLNASRELWKQAFAAPLIFWLPEFAAALLDRYAPDFAAWISHRFEFAPESIEFSAAMADSLNGDLAAASNLDADRKQFRIAELEQRIAAAGDPPPSPLASHVVTWLNELGHLYRITGNLGDAEERHRRALALCEAIGNAAGVGDQHGNLGLIYLTRGDLDRAELLFEQALAFHRQLDRPEAIAAAQGNLGLTYYTRGQMDRAAESFRAALAIHHRLGDLAGAATDLGNLGLVLIAQGKLDQAEDMLRKALGLYTRVGERSGSVTQHSNLGVLYRMRGDLERAEDMHRQALELSRKLGRIEGEARQLSNLGLINADRGSLDKAEKYLREALAIDMHVGCTDYLAADYANLGIILKARGDNSGAEHLWTKARDLYQQIGNAQKTAQIQAWLDAAPRKVQE